MALAGVAGANIAVGISVEIGPVESAAEAVEGLLDAEVAGEGHIVGFVEEAAAESSSIGDAESAGAVGAGVVPQVAFLGKSVGAVGGGLEDVVVGVGVGDGFQHVGVGVTVGEG